ncbi:hypothetical protein [Crateriforma conspicua]|uniref:Uncharacterized protein n=1 Tax=Crateriforma conspicua TaxID=2527996 RepID=A0A5C5YGX7_9PLAN|nr:hypothetical protein [Crateriforma conspicua]QDV61266.1 hypothetical protein Mal65_03890 [Crateriforma conspicua]TWT72482.1 hypothetical protein Pan14r_48020 [Crateriforma conspicua]
MTKLFLGAALSVAMLGTTAFAEDCQSGQCLEEGSQIGAFHVTKVAGAEEDGVEVGEKLCYRCRYGSRPMVMVFTRTTEGKLPEFVQKLDKAVESHQDAQLKGLVTLIGGESEQMKKSGEKFASAAKAKNIPVVVSDDANGPSSYKIPEDAEVAIVVANESQVVASHTYKADAIDIADVMKHVQEMLN